MQCVEFTLNGVRVAVAGGAGTRSIENRIYFFPPSGRGSFSVAGYADPNPSLSQRIFWAGGDLRLGDVLRVRVVESEEADSGEIQTQWGESFSPDGSNQTCLFCGKAKDEAAFFMVAKAGAICGECITSAAEDMKRLPNR